MGLVAQRPDRYVRSPVLLPAAGGATLFAVAWTPAGEHVLTASVAADGAVDEGALGPAQPAIQAVDARGEVREDDTEAAWSDGVLRVTVERDGAVSRVVLHRGDAGRVLVWEAEATAAAPFVLRAAGGAWVAFHHNLREDTGAPDLAKWIALRFVSDAGEVLEPTATMTDRDRDREGEEQSFEFPTLTVGPDGALAMFGRGAHAFWRQDVSAAGFTPRALLGEGAWGCRGRRVAALALSDALLTARREKAGIEVSRAALPSGGPPALGPATVRPAVCRVAPRVVPRVHDPAARDGRVTLFGDIHQHSAHSDGIGAADEPYLRARYTYGDDFCALSDHESFLGKRIGPGEWRVLEAAAERHNAPGEFATLLAFEWTGRMHPGPGHKVVYLPRPGLPVFSRDVLTTGEALVAALGPLGALAVPHHVGWTGADEAAHDPAVQPVWEICSCHGCYETWKHELGQRGDLRDQMVDAVLARGLRFGFIASSDGHGLLWHHGVARKRDPFRTGLACVQAKARTREAILAALRERRCYATSGEKILLDLRVDGAPMGAAVRTGERVRVEASVRGTGALASLELVSRDGVVHAEAPSAEDARLDLRLPRPGGHLYLRVRQRDGEMAWSSPVFFDL